MRDHLGRVGGPALTIRTWHDAGVPTEGIVTTMLRLRVEQRERRRDQPLDLELQGREAGALGMTTVSVRSCDVDVAPQLPATLTVMFDAPDVMSMQFDDASSIPGRPFAVRHLIAHRDVGQELGAVLPRHRASPLQRGLLNALPSLLGLPFIGGLLARLVVRGPRA